MELLSSHTSLRFLDVKGRSDRKDGPSPLPTEADRDSFARHMQAAQEGKEGPSESSATDSSRERSDADRASSSQDVAREASREPSAQQRSSQDRADQDRADEDRSEETTSAEQRTVQQGSDREDSAGHAHSIETSAQPLVSEAGVETDLPLEGMLALDVHEGQSKFTESTGSPSSLLGLSQEGSASVGSNQPLTEPTGFASATQADAKPIAGTADPMLAPLPEPVTATATPGVSQAVMEAVLGVPLTSDGIEVASQATSVAANQANAADLAKLDLSSAADKEPSGSQGDADSLVAASKVQALLDAFTGDASDEFGELPESLREANFKAMTTLGEAAPDLNLLEVRPNMTGAESALKVDALAGADTSLRTPDMARHEAVMAQIQAKLQPGLQKATIRLNPEELGQVKIEVTVEKGEVRADLRVESKEALQILQRNAPELRALFAQAEMELTELNVQLGDQGQLGEQGPDQDPNSQQESSPKSRTQSNTPQHGLHQSDAGEWTSLALPTEGLNLIA